MAKTTGLDELDQLIMSRLRADGRTSLTSLAAEAGVKESTVASRIRRLQDERVLRVTAVVDMETAGFPYQMFCFIRVRERAVEDVARDLAEVDETLAVFVTFGEYDIVTLVRARDLHHIGILVHNELAAVPGVERIDTDLCLDMRRYYPDVAILAG